MNPVLLSLIQNGLIAGVVSLGIALVAWLRERGRVQARALATAAREQARKETEEAKAALAAQTRATELSELRLEQAQAIYASAESSAERMRKELTEYGTRKDGEVRRLELDQVELRTRLDSVVQNNNVLTQENVQLRFNEKIQASQMAGLTKRLQDAEYRIVELDKDRNILIGALQAAHIPLPQELYRRPGAMPPAEGAN